MSWGRIFRAFHALVVETVGRLESETWPADNPDLDTVRAPILAAIAGVGERLGEEPDADPAVVRQFLFLLAVYADDRAMAARWPGVAAWNERRLESELFGSALGAGEVEARCERLLTVPTPDNRQLARLFLYAFGLGLGAGGGGERLDGLRRRLLEFSRPTRQRAVTGQRSLFRQAYRYTAARGERRLLPDFRGWLVLAAALLLVFALVSTFAWEGAVQGVSEALASPRGPVAPAAVEPAAAVGRPAVGGDETTSGEEPGDYSPAEGEPGEGGA